MMIRPSLIATLALTAVAASAETVTVGLYAVGDAKGASSLSPSSMALTVGQAPAATLQQLAGVSRTGYMLATNEWKASLYKNVETDRVFDAAWCAENATTDVLDAQPQSSWTMLVVPVTPNPYTVTFDSNGGTGSMSAQSFVYDAPQNLLLNAFTRTGHTFAHWRGPGSRTFADGEVVSNLTATAGDTVTLTAQWTANTYRITLDAGEADTPGTEEVDAVYGRTFPDITLPTRGGYSFKGYYTQPNGQGHLCYSSNGKPGTSDLAADVTLYAYWIQNPTVTFHIYDGTFLNGWTEKTNYVEGVGMSLPGESDVAYADHTFVGWYDNEAFEDSRVKSIPSTATGDKTFYARWEEKTYKVSFDANGGAGRGEQKLSMANSDRLKTLAELAIGAPQGYTFKEWNMVKDGSGNSYADGAVIQNNLTNVANATVTLYAQWTPNPYEVAFHPNGADGGETMGNQAFIYDEPQNLNPVGFTYTGHDFRGWSTTTNRPSSFYADGAAVANLATGGVTTLYANWTGIVYTVTFDANGGTGAMDPMSCTYDMPTNLPDCAFTRDGWGLKGWMADGAEDVLFADGARVTNLAATAGAEVALHACWTGVTYAVTLDARDPRGDGMLTNAVGEAAGGVLTNFYTVGEVWNLPAPTNVNTHLVFDGWTYVDAQRQTQGVPDEVPPPSSGTTNLVAAWTWQADKLARAVDAPELEFDTFGTVGPQGNLNDPLYEANWFEQSDCAREGGTAVQSGALNVGEEDGNNYASWLTMTVQTNGVLTFWWKCSAADLITNPEYGDSSGETLQFGICAEDGSFERKAVVTGVTDWVQVVYTNEAEQATTFAWKFQYDYGGGDSGGTGWVDHVTWVPVGGTQPDEPQPDDPQPPAIQEYTVTFAANGGEGTMSYQTFTNGVSAALTLNAFTKDGHTFAGWATAAVGEVVYADGASVSNLTDIAGGTVVLYAVWTPNQYTITFRDREEDIASTTQAYGTEVSAPADPLRTGYTFAGWTPAAPATVPASNITCVAQWTANTYTVKFDANGGEGEMSDQTFTYDLVSSLSSNVFEKSDSTFAGWATAADGEVVYADRASVSNLMEVAGGTVTLYARWTKIDTPDPEPDPGPDPVVTFEVTFAANGGEGEMAGQTFTNGVEQALTSNAFVRTDYAFAGWATDAAGNVVYKDGQVVTLTTNMVLYAAWTEIDTPDPEPDPDPEPVSGIAFTASVVSAGEGSNAVVRVFGGDAEKASSVKVYLAYNTAAAADVNWKTAAVIDDNRWQANADDGGIEATNLAFPLTLKWAAGDVGEKLIVIPVKADALVEGEEFFTLQLAAASGAELGAQTVCTVRIADAQWPEGMDAEETAAAARAALPAGATATTVTTVADGVTNSVVTGYFTKKNSKGNVTAKAMPGYVFVAWVYVKNGKTYSTKATITDKLRKSKKVQPKFAVARVLRVLADPANGGKVTGGGKYAHGKAVTLKATPNKYWTFEGWTPVLSKSKSLKVSVTNDTTYAALFKPYPKVKLAVDNKSGGTVKGAGSYKTGTKVTLKATPKKGYAFTGWWQVAVDADGVYTTNRVSLASSYTYKVTADGLALTASFKKESALARPVLTWNGATNLTVGVSYSGKPSVTAESAVKVTKVTGLPKGLAYKSGKASGVPTTKKVYTAKVTVALKSNAKKTWTYSVKLDVAALPAWAAGKTFKGTLYDGPGEDAAAKGTVTLTVGKTGKVSGKFVNLKKTAYAFTASSFKAYGEDGVLRTSATMKYGKKSVKLDVAVGSEKVTGEDGSEGLAGFAEISSSAAPFSGETVTLR